MQSDEIKIMFSPYFREFKYQKGEILWNEGDTDGMMILIISGSVKIFRNMPDGNSVTFFILQSGDLFGFLPMVDGGPYSVSAETLEDLSALAITHMEFRNILNKTWIVFNEQKNEYEAGEGFNRDCSLCYRYSYDMETACKINQ